MKQKNKEKAITLIALVITIIVLLLLAGITIFALTGENGILAKASMAKEKNNEKEATEIINLKITSVQMQSYTETQTMPTLQYLANKLCEDNEIQYVELETKKSAKLDEIIVGEAKSIFTKLKDYPYEFEIDSKLRLASINGIQVADDKKENEEIIELKNAVTNLQEAITSQQAKITSLQTEVEGLKQEKRKDYNYSSLGTEKEIGTWYDGTPMYELSLEITLPSTSTAGIDAKIGIDLQKYNIKECVIGEGFFKTSTFILSFPQWVTTSSPFARALTYYNTAEKKLFLNNSNPNYNGAKGYITLHYNKNN